jgi:hypothetical protein
VSSFFGRSLLGLAIDAGTARTRWVGKRMDYSMAIEGMYFEKHGRT